MAGKSQKIRDFTISQPWSDSLFKLHCIIFCMCRIISIKNLKKCQKKEKRKAIEQSILIQLFLFSVPFLFLFIFVFLYLVFFFLYSESSWKEINKYIEKNNIYSIGFIHSSVFGLQQQWRCSQEMNLVTLCFCKDKVYNQRRLLSQNTQLKRNLQERRRATPHWLGAFCFVTKSLSRSRVAVTWHGD